jgi:hypothetical protein
MNDYNKLFSKFYGDLFKFQGGKKTHLRCPGCQNNKRFIIDDDKLTFSCGPGDNSKCGKQYTIILPKYIHFKTLRDIYEKQINGSLGYTEKDISQYDLKELSQKMDVKDELSKQTDLIKNSTQKLEKLIKDMININNFDGYIETLETLSKKRYKNSIDKKHLMKQINDIELSEPERIELRKKYAQLIQENKEFIDMIIELRKPDINYILINKSEIINHKKDKDKDKD